MVVSAYVANEAKAAMRKMIMRLSLASIGRALVSGLWVGAARMIGRLCDVPGIGRCDGRRVFVRMTDHLARAQAKPTHDEAGSTLRKIEAAPRVATQCHLSVITKP